MAKIKTGLVKQIEEEKAAAEEQERLRKKHKVKDENVKVVEKSGFNRFFFTMIRIIAEIILLILAAVGILALIYDEPRVALVKILLSMQEQIIH